VTSHDQVFLNNVVEETILIRNKTLKYFEGTPRAYEINERKLCRALIKNKEALDKKRENASFSLLIHEVSRDV
jgi:ATPase subunit of ABC transporter with duplicated ATPase domains